MLFVMAFPLNTYTMNYEAWLRLTILSSYLYVATN